MKALVTGASRGLGAAIARRLAAAGYEIVVAYARRERDAKTVQAEIEAAGGQAEVVKLRLDQPQELAAGLGELGPIDLLVNNAAMAGEGHFAMQSVDTLDEVLRVGLQGAMHCAHAVLRPMLAARQGCIVNVGSVITLRGQPGRVAYATAKGGLEAFTRALARDVAGRGIRVNAVVPGIIDAGMTRGVSPATRADWEGHVPMGRLGEAEDVADAVAFLASDAAKYITGHCLVVDGGLSL